MRILVFIIISLILGLNFIFFAEVAVNCYYPLEWMKNVSKGGEVFVVSICFAALSFFLWTIIYRVFFEQ